MNMNLEKQKNGRSVRGMNFPEFSLVVEAMLVISVLIVYRVSMNIFAHFKFLEEFGWIAGAIVLSILSSISIFYRGLWQNVCPGMHRERTRTGSAVFPTLSASSISPHAVMLNAGIEFTMPEGTPAGYGALPSYALGRVPATHSTFPAVVIIPLIVCMAVMLPALYPWKCEILALTGDRISEKTEDCKAKPIVAALSVAPGPGGGYMPVRHDPFSAVKLVLNGIVFPLVPVIPHIKRTTEKGVYHEF